MLSIMRKNQVSVCNNIIINHYYITIKIKYFNINKSSKNK